MAFTDDIKTIVRSWQQHFAMQFATVSVLTATFSIVAFLVCLSLNFQRVLSVWGEQVQISAYLKDGVSSIDIETLQKDLTARADISNVEFISKQKAVELFRDQMASYAPELISDTEFATPFPASFQIRMRSAQATDLSTVELEKLAGELKKNVSVEDVSYGQSWVRNYASFVGVVQAVGGVIGLILLFGGIFIVGNSIRTLIAGRHDEIEILELIGATSNRIRRPYIFEGVFLCAIAASVALAANAVLFAWQIMIMRQSLAFARMAQEFQFFTVLQVIEFLMVACLIGGLGSWISVRRFNDGWSAARGIRR